MTYNITQLQDSVTVLDIIKTANTASNDIFVGGFLVAIFMVMVMGMRKYSFINAMLVSSFVCGILSLFLWYAKIVNFTVCIIFIAIFSVTMFMSFFKQSPSE